MAFARFEVRPEPSKAIPFCERREPEEMQRGGEQERGMSPGFDGIVQLDIIH